MKLESIIEKKCLHLMKKALHFQASDVHMLPSKEGYQIYFRKFNRLIAAGEIPIDLGSKMISHFKYQSVLDIGEKRRPQSGSFEYKENSEVIACRVSTLPSVSMLESLVIRLLPQNNIQTLESIAYSPLSVKRLQNLAHSAQGIILFCGPTGCGKSTTMYSLLNYCSKQLSKHVISLEDPVENNQQHLLQVQVNEKSGVTYASGLKAILRHSPDVIMIGEIRDKETAEIAIEAALTGHLVISTIHAKNSFGCLHRLIDLGISEEELKQTILGVVSQKLISKNDENATTAALYEILSEQNLIDSFEAIKRRETFQMPLDETIHYQMIRGIRDENIIQNAFTT